MAESESVVSSSFWLLASAADNKVVVLVDNSNDEFAVAVKAVPLSVFTMLLFAVRDLAWRRGF
jgi:hypothetical protein